MEIVEQTVPVVVLVNSIRTAGGERCRVHDPGADDTPHLQCDQAHLANHQHLDDAGPGVDAEGAAVDSTQVIEVTSLQNQGIAVIPYLPTALTILSQQDLEQTTVSADISVNDSESALNHA